MIILNVCLLGLAFRIRNLDSQQTLPSILGINGELHRQASRYTSGVESRSTGLHLTGIMCRQHLDLEGAPWHFFFTIQHRNAIGPFSAGHIVDSLSTISIVHYIHWLHQAFGPLHFDLQWGNSSFACVHLKGLREVGTDHAWA